MYVYVCMFTYTCTHGDLAHAPRIRGAKASSRASRAAGLGFIGLRGWGFDGPLSTIRLGYRA